MQSAHVKISNNETDIQKVYDALDKYIADTGIAGKSKMRLRLLTEEAIRFAKLFTEEKGAEVWFSGDNKVTNIFLEADKKLDDLEKKKLISLASNGENSEESSFFSMLAKTFIMMPEEEDEWTLGKYKEEMIQRRLDDRYAERAWEDLERSLLANLSDDIKVGIKRDKITMVITKILMESAQNTGSRVPLKTTGPIVLNNNKEMFERALERADEHIQELELAGRDQRHLRLLFEEAIGMMGAIAGDFETSVWFEKYNDEYCLKLRASTFMDAEKKKQLLAVSTDGQNSLAKGTMGKIRDVIENGLLHYDMVSHLQQQYGTGNVQFGTIGMFGGTESLAETGVMWSLHEYELGIENDKDGQYKEAWDELEKSIVASIAKDVLVGVKSDSFEMTFIADRTKE
ncbi:hypothetical protein [Butyrivibrio sp. YAB3001]|uniref:hypothetical protein n=1 Tax=Butyrivibrio sp. YAB3001 TaxID=1520812 RepID=UPI0008F6469B|nr:hypothetical protein [Butyrivibrio sp. YAB3001]SFB97484.1 hypothetical protein SAMN02910398_01188 [Butyrivibrio sp. YAB3001]